jgi:hypothetical protein
VDERAAGAPAHLGAQADAEQQQRLGAAGQRRPTPGPACAQVLADGEQRALYDAISGFADSSVNPFADRSFPADQARAPA